MIVNQIFICHLCMYIARFFFFFLFVSLRLIFFPFVFSHTVTFYSFVFACVFCAMVNWPNRFNFIHLRSLIACIHWLFSMLLFYRKTNLNKIDCKIEIYKYVFFLLNARWTLWIGYPVYDYWWLAILKHFFFCFR